MKKNQIKEHFDATFRRLTAMNYGFRLLKHLFGPLYNTCTHVYYNETRLCAQNINTDTCSTWN